MIDKLEVRILAGTEFMPDVDSLFFSMVGHPSDHYAGVYDLRPRQNAILHRDCLHGKRTGNGRQGSWGNHKLELLDTGSMTYSEIVAEIQDIVCIDAKSLSIMRLDLAVDIEGISVRWFLENTRVARKRWLGKLGVQTAALGKGEPQTLYYGKRPNLIRIYNKVEECLARYRKMLHQIGIFFSVCASSTSFGAYTANICFMDFK